MCTCHDLGKAKLFVGSSLMSYTPDWNLGRDIVKAEN